MLFIILFVIISSVALVGYMSIPYLYSQATLAGQRRKKNLQAGFERTGKKADSKKMAQMFVLAPVVCGGACYLLFPAGMQFLGVILGVIVGLLFPGIYLKTLVKKNQEKFHLQLVDSLMIMSSSFRGGLSLVQALEAVVEEMPDPIASEFASVLGENKMGVSLEEAMYHLYKRMPSVSLQQMITAILLARETGGNLPIIFSKIVTNIRENRKIQQNLDTLTLQGKIQGFVMALLPIGFGFVIFSANKRIFMNMVHTQLGQGLLTYAVISELIGAYMIVKISSFKEF